MTIKTKIIAAMAMALFAALAVGGIGLYSLRATAQDLKGMYEDAFAPVVDVTEIRTLMHENRAALGAALMSAQAVDVQRLHRLIDANEQRADRHWANYYPAKVSDGEEADAAKAFMAARTQTIQAVDAQLALLAGPDRPKALAYMNDTVSAAYASQAKAIESIVGISQKQADEAYADASVRQREALYATLFMVALGVALVGLVGWLLTRAVMRPLLRAKGLAERISHGELNHGLQIEGSDEFADMLRSLKIMDEQLTKIVSSVRHNAGQVMRATQDISAGNDNLSQRTQEQASSLEETAASMKEMSDTVRRNADGAGRAKGITGELREDASTGHRIAGEAINAMEMITQASDSIGDIASLIDEIAFQTNLLALNATIEAARAGAHGKGFTVVAMEVRALAQRSAEAAKSIKQLISDSSVRVTHGASLVRQTGQSLDHILHGAHRVAGIVEDITVASAQQSAGIDQVSDAVMLLDQVTQENAALVEEASAASHQTMELAKDLVKQVGFFTIHEGGKSAANHGQAVAGQRKPFGTMGQWLKLSTASR